jgi:hypothetical protein
MFLLAKWYCDVVTDAGACAIIYAARLRWGPLRVGYASTLYLAADAPPQEAATLRRVASPRADGDCLTWRNAPLRAEACWRRDAPRIERCLAHGPDGDVAWTCHMPRARASVQIGDAHLEGLGYVESLRLAMPPWKLPFRTLRWGRHLSAEHCLVWIVWTGGEERRWVWLDGVEQPAATLHDGGLVGLAGGAELLWHDGRDLRDRPLLATIAGPLPALARRLAGPLAHLHEHKRLAPSAIVRAGRPLDHGWTVSEDVTW